MQNNLSDKVAALYDLLVGKGNLCVAESFTGGGICANLVLKEGMSNLLKKGIVCYSNQSKIIDLNVDKSIIDNFGAVSQQTASAMLDGIIALGFDFAIATTGNAGPTAEKQGEEGVCYLAVATKFAKSIIRTVYFGTRNQNIQSGIEGAIDLALDFFRENLK